MFIDFSDAEDIKIWNAVLRQQITEEQKVDPHTLLTNLTPEQKALFKIGEALFRATPREIDMSTVTIFTDPDGLTTNTARATCPVCKNSIPIYLDPEPFFYCPKCGQLLEYEDSVFLKIFDPTGELGLTLDELEKILDDDDKNSI